jgi:hypothetical protein
MIWMMIIALNSTIKRINSLLKLLMRMDRLRLAEIKDLENR